MRSVAARSSVLFLAALPLASILAPEADAGVCNPTRLWVQPGAALARNGVLLIEATGENVEVVNASLARMRLVGDGVSVPLHVRRRIEGEVLELVVAPASPLPARTPLRFMFGDAKADEWSAVMTTTEVLSEAPPRWTAAPRVVTRRRDSEKAEHHEVHVIGVRVENASHVWASITSRDGVASADIEPIRDGQIEVGTKTCLGIGNHMAGQGPWRVTLTAIGAGGQEVVAPGDPIVIPVAPRR